MRHNRNSFTFVPIPKFFALAFVFIIGIIFAGFIFAPLKIRDNNTAGAWGVLFLNRFAQSESIVEPYGEISFVAGEEIPFLVGQTISAAINQIQEQLKNLQIELIKLRLAEIQFSFDRIHAEIEELAKIIEFGLQEESIPQDAPIFP